MKKILVLIAMTMWFLVSSGTAWSACDPNKNCTRRGPDVPCPTWDKPLRMCPSYYDDPVCTAERLACAGTLAACVTSALVGSTAGAACVGCLVAAIGGTGGTTAAACAPACGITAAAAEQVVQKCQ